MTSVSRTGTSEDYISKLLAELRSGNTEKAQKSSADGQVSFEVSEDMDISQISEEGLQLKNFMDKVKAGTVTESDLKEMQNTLSSSSEYGIVKNPGKAVEDDFTAELKLFLDKVKNGKVSESDLSDMQTKLAEMENRIGSKVAVQPKGKAAIASAPELNSAHSMPGPAVQSGKMNSLPKTSDSESSDELDANGDGVVTTEEYLAYYSKPENVSSGDKEEGTETPEGTSKILE